MLLESNVVIFFWQGSGKTSLLSAILGQGQQEGNISSELSPLDVNNHKAVAGGVCYSVSKGVNLQVIRMFLKIPILQLAESMLYIFIILVVASIRQ